MFVNVTHHSQLKDKKVRRSVYSFTQKKVRNRREEETEPRNSDIIPRTNGNGNLQRSWRAPLGNGDQQLGKDRALLVHRSSPQPQRRDELMSPTEAMIFGFPDEPLYQTLGGFRGDPFNIYPIPNTMFVETAIEFYTQSWALSNWSNILPSKPTPQSALSVVFPWLITSPLAFEGVICCSLILGIPEARRLGSRSSLSVLKHRSNVLNGLHVKLAKQEIDAQAIHAVCSLIAMDVVFNDFQSVKLHVKGLSEMLRFVNIDELGVHGFVKHCVEQIQAVCERMIKVAERHGSPETLPSPEVLKEEVAIDSP